MDYIGLTRWQSIGRDLSSLDRDASEGLTIRGVRVTKEAKDLKAGRDPKLVPQYDISLPRPEGELAVKEPATFKSEDYSSAFSDLSQDELQRSAAELKGRISKILHLKATLAPPPPASSPHWGSGLYRTLRRLSKGFSMGYGIKFALTALPLLLKSRGNLVKFVSSFKSSHFISPIRHGLFLSSFLTIFENFMSLTRGSRDLGRPGRSLLAGFLAGLAILLVPGSGRTDIALFAVVRAIEVLIRLAGTKPGVPSIPHLDSLVFAISSAQIIWTWIYERDSLEASYTGFLNNHAGGRQNFALAYAHLSSGYKSIPADTKEGLLRGYPVYNGSSKLKQSELETNLNVNASKVPASTGSLPSEIADSCNRFLASKKLSLLTPNTLQNPQQCMCHLFHPHAPENCLLGHLSFFPEAFRVSLRTYLPIYVIPSLLFRWRYLLKTPRKFFENIASNTFRSTLFFSAYAVTAFGHVCTLRNLYSALHKSNAQKISQSSKTPHWLIWLSGFLGASSIFIEKPERRVELSLFASAHAIRALVNTLVRRKLLPFRPVLASTLAFALSSSILMYAFLCEPMLIRPSNFALLRFLFGSGGARLRFPSTNDRKATSEWLSELQYFLADDAPEPTVPISPPATNLKLQDKAQLQQQATTTEPAPRYSIAAGERILKSSQSFAHLSQEEQLQKLDAMVSEVAVKSNLQGDKAGLVATTEVPFSQASALLTQAALSPSLGKVNDSLERSMFKEKSYRVLAPAQTKICEEEEEEEEEELTMDADEVQTHITHT